MSKHNIPWLGKHSNHSSMPQILTMWSYQLHSHQLTTSDPTKKRFAYVIANFSTTSFGFLYENYYPKFQNTFFPVPISTWGVCWISYNIYWELLIWILVITSLRYVVMSLLRYVIMPFCCWCKPVLTHLRLPKDSVNSQNMVKYFIEQYQGHIQLFFIEHLSKVLER